MEKALANVCDQVALVAFGAETRMRSRARAWPDERADVGEHRMRYTLFPHSGDWRAAGAVARAAAFARPLLMAAGGPHALLKRSLVEATPVGVVIETIKPAEDGEGFVVRLYESFGARASAYLAFGVPIREAWLSNTLEDLFSPLAIEAGTVALALRPFQIATFTSEMTVATAFLADRGESKSCRPLL